MYDIGIKLINRDFNSKVIFIEELNVLLVYKPRTLEQDLKVYNFINKMNPLNAISEVV